MILPEGTEEQFKRDVQAVQSGVGSAPSMESQKAQAQRVWPYLTPNDKFWLACEILTNEVEQKLQALRCLTLQSGNLARIVQQKYPGWVGHVAVPGIGEFRIITEELNPDDFT